MMKLTESGHGATSLVISMDGTSPMSPLAASRAALWLEKMAKPATSTGHSSALESE